MPVPTSFATARTTLVSLRAATASALYARTVAQQNLDAALRSGDSGAITAAQNALTGASTALGNARGAEAFARSTLNGLINGWLTIPNSNPVQPLAIDDDLARLDVAGVPIALFPVRLETRFDLTKPVLHIRIYPDEFFSDIHERELTPDELAAGQAYWSAVQANNNTETSDIWAPVAKRYGVPRAAYIVDVTDPSSEATLPSPRATVPSRGAEAVLPDRWVALAYKGGALRHIQPGLPIPEPLDLTANPSADDQTLVEVANGFKVPSNILWTVQYQDAFDKGMAIDIGNLSPDEIQGGFDRIVVVGVKTSMDPLSASQMISRLFDAHHYTRGLDLVPLGTPTNNVPGQPTPFSMKDPPAERSFQIERLGPDFSNEGAGNLDFGVLSELFGYDFENGPFTFLGGAVDSQQDIATGQSMRYIVWPATLGYFLKQMMNPGASLSTSTTATIFPDALIQNAKDFFTGYVSAQGPAPAFRVGAVPYGLLPAISYSRMTPQTGENSDAMEVIRKLVPIWQQAAALVPVVPQNSSDRNTDLMTVLSQKSSSDGVYVRNSIGPDTITNLYQFLLQDLAAYFMALAQVPSATLGAIGHSNWSAARVFELLFSSSISQYAGPLVTAHPQQGMLVSALNPVFNPNDPTTFNYLRKLGDASLLFTDVQDQGALKNVAPPGELTPLLYLIARHSLLLEIIAAARSSASSVLTPVFNPPNLPKILEIDFELWGIVTTAGQADLTTILTTQPSGGGGKSVFQLVQSEGFDTHGNPFDGGARYATMAGQLREVSGLPVSELERVFTETLDLAAHRLDAYVTALGTRRLTNFRDSENSAANQTYFGGYGVVENVRPVTRTTRQVNGVTYDVQLDNGGYVHAPSPRHATAAAILRSGRMAEQDDPTKYAIELPSDRARRARLLVDGVRNGQTLGELLGFELESGLRASGAPQPEAIILALRQLYPLVANKSGLDPGQPADRIAAANVVDGQLVRQAAASPAGIPFGTTGVLAAGKTFILAQVQVLNDIVDSVADLEMSEAIFQVAAGDVASAEAAMNFLPDGSNPPQSEVTNSPTTGIPVSHRVALLLEGTAPAPVVGWTLVSTPQTPSRSLRGQADPFAEAWVGSLLGDPTSATATVTYQLNGVPQTGTVRVSDINTLGPLDFLALAQSTSASGQGSPLDRQLAAALKAKVPGATGIVVSGYDTPTSGPSIPQLIELGRALGGVLGGARELAAADFVLTPDDVNDASLDPSGVTGQATTAINTLSALVQSFDGADPRTILASASLYQAEAFPDPGGTDSDLAVQVMNAKGELGRRVTDAQAAAVGGSASNAEKIAAAINQLRILFGRNTLVVLPNAVPPGSGELQQSLAALDQPLDLTNPNLNLGDPNTFAPHQAPGRYLQQASRVHERLGAWRRFGLYAGALLGTPSPRVSVAQLPFVTGEQWVGRVAPSDRRTSLLFISANGQTNRPDATQVWRGLLLDQWSDVVPGATAETGLAFHYDSQNSEAPQVILMAVQSRLTANWNVAELAAIVNETLDLAQIRPVDNDKLPLGQLVPAICLASNLQNYVVSTHVDLNARQDVPIVVG
jgi:hypothetical protein